MTVRLRAHHLLCLLTYIGKGYNDQFKDNFNAVVHRLMQGEAILLVEGPDDICLPLVSTCSESESELHCLQPHLLKRDQQAAAAMAELLGYPIEPGLQLTLTATQLETMRRRFALGTCRAACKGCEWFDLCTMVAESNFQQTQWQLKWPPKLKSK